MDRRQLIRTLAATALTVTALLLCITLHAQRNDLLSCTIDADGKAQMIDNIGASAAWFSEGIGRYWPQSRREQLARWLFSSEWNRNGSPQGIALSAFRFNIGGGTAEQGDSSGIKDFRKRAECFLQPDGSYDWNKQSGYCWFVRKAAAYGVENLIAFSNTPPVQFTQNGLGYKTEGDFRANLRPDRYGDYAAFLAAVLQHFDKEGLHFRYISPVNEPQWAWTDKYGQASQEGSPWRNEEIAAVVRSLDSALTRTGSTAKILITEAGNLEYLYGRTDGAATHQVQQFFKTGSPLQLTNCTHLLNAAGGHSYFTDNGDSSRIAFRLHLADTVHAYGTRYWQTEYSMLGDGYREGRKGKIPAMDCALFLAKVIHDDLVYGNAAAWQLWNSWEPGDSAFDTRYYLVALHPSDNTFTDGGITATKNLWALGHYSRFIRPGMQRLDITREDGLTREQVAQQVMVSAFAGDKKLVLVAINYTDHPQTLQPSLRHFKKSRNYKRYLTTADKDVNMKCYQGKDLSRGIPLPPRSITTIVAAAAPQTNTPAPRPASDSVFLFSYFKGNGEDGLHLATSEDGYTWTALKGDSSFLQPTVAKDRLMRDPCIIRGPDGLFHMVWTVSWKDRGIGYASSPDGVHWSTQEFIPVMAHEPAAKNCWAPEIIYDAPSRQYMIYWATTIPGRFPATDSLGDNNHRIYYTLTRDFKKFTPAKILYDQGFNAIDATIQRSGDGYIMFLKDETLRPRAQKNIHIAFSKSLDKGYGQPSPSITGNYWAEGPTAIYTHGKWIVYFDKYMDHRYGAVESADLLHWTDVSDRVHFPPGTRHGTVLRVLREEVPGASLRF